MGYYKVNKKKKQCEEIDFQDKLLQLFKNKGTEEYI